MNALLLLLLLLQMSDATAIGRARALWGMQAGVSPVRFGGDSNWTREVGVKSVGCALPFTAIGSGFNTWEAAFDNAAQKVIKIAGPFKQTISIQAEAWDNVGVDSVQFYINSLAYSMPVLAPVPLPNKLIAITMLDTTALPSGVHVLCVSAKDAAGNVGRSRAYLFRVDQSTFANPNEGVWKLSDGIDGYTAIVP